MGFPEDMGVIMSDGIYDAIKESEELRLGGLNSKRLADRLRELRECHEEYHRVHKDLLSLGYHIDGNGNSIKIWKEVEI